MTSPYPDASKYAEAAIGAALVLLGAGVVAGWLLRNPVLVQLMPGLTPMALNTGIGFVLSGGWLTIVALRPAWRPAARVLSLALLVLAAAVTLQYAVGVDFGIDAPGLHRWLPSAGAHPGRMSAFTGIAFVLAGLAMPLATGPSRPKKDTLALLLASGTGIVGVAALVGYLFELHLIYAGYAPGPVPLHTAVGLIALAVALWLHLIRLERLQLWNRWPVHERITIASAAILTLASLSVGVAVFAVLQARVGQALSDSLTMTLRYRVLLAEAVIEGALQRSRILVGRPAPARALRRYKERPGDAAAIMQLSQSAASLVADGYRAVIYFDADGREIIAAGGPVLDPRLRVPLRGAPGATLAWENGFILSGHYPLRDADGPIGAAIVQVPIPALDALLGDGYRLGESGEAGMCARVGDEQLACFPQPRNPAVYFIPTTAPNGEPLPMTRALAGESGISLTQDYRGHHTMAAYAPVGDFGLAMVAKADTAEIYAPVRERLQLILPILAALILAGTLLLRTGVRPLAARLAQSEREARERHRALNSMMASVADGIMMLDADGTIRSWNAAAEKLFGYTAEEVVGRNLSMLVPEDLQANVAAVRRFHATDESQAGERVDLNFPARRKDGSRFELEFTATGMGDGKAPRRVAVFRDITARKEAEERLAWLALHDPLTGLPNRAYFEQRFADAFARCRRTGEPIALMILDVDNFKPVNDTLGHEVGDRLLIAFTRSLKAALRESDLLARIGGDEFTIVIEGLKGPEDTVAIADKVLTSLRDPIDVAGHAIIVSASIGIALCHSDDTPQGLMKRADEALYEAKRSGRARYHVA